MEAMIAALCLLLLLAGDILLVVLLLRSRRPADDTGHTQELEDWLEERLAARPTTLTKNCGPASPPWPTRTTPPSAASRTQWMGWAPS